MSLKIVGHFHSRNKADRTCRSEGWGDKVFTWRVVVGSSLPLDDGVPPSSDAVVTGEEAIILSLNAPNTPSVLRHADTLLPVRFLSEHSVPLSGYTEQPLSLLRLGPVRVDDVFTGSASPPPAQTHTHTLPLLLMSPNNTGL